MTALTDLDTWFKGAIAGCERRGARAEMYDHRTAVLITEAADALEDLRIAVIAFGAPHAVRYAEDFGLKPGELHPRHYDILERCGARMVDFRRANENVLSRTSDAEEST